MVEDWSPRREGADCLIGVLSSAQYIMYSSEWEWVSDEAPWTHSSISLAQTRGGEEIHEREETSGLFLHSSHCQQGFSCWVDVTQELCMTATISESSSQCSRRLHQYKVEGLRGQSEQINETKWANRRRKSQLPRVWIPVKLHGRLG